MPGIKGHWKPSNLLLLSIKNPLGRGKNPEITMDEKIIEQLSEMGVTEADLKNPEKVKELAERFESENKAKAEPVDKILNDQLGRLAKAISKRLVNDEPKTERVISDLDIDNRVFVKTKNLTQDQINILNEYSHLPKFQGKSLEEIYGSNAVQTEMKAIEMDIATKNEIDENEKGESRLRETKNEIFEKYSKTGENPKTEYEMKIVAEKELEASGFRVY